MDEKDKETMALIGVAVFFVAGGGLATVMGTAVPAIRELLVEWTVLVPASKALVEIPGTGLGPSVPVVLLVLGLICLLAVFSPMFKRKGRGESR